MDIPTTIVLIAVVVLVVAYVIQPYVAGSDQARSVRRRTSGARLRERSELLAQRIELYSALRELDFDYTTNKIADQDYAAQRKALVTQGVEILQRLDMLSLDETAESDPIEAAVRAIRMGQPIAATAGPARGSSRQASKRQSRGGGRNCPKCGSPTGKNDRFCTSCGQKLNR
jgi:hypothetical protein